MGLSKASWTKGRGAIPKASPPKDPPGILSKPTTLASLGPAGVPSVTLSPISSPAPSAAAPSMVSSRSFSGNLPSVSSKPVASSADSGSTPKRRMLWISGRPSSVLRSRIREDATEYRGAAEPTPPVFLISSTVSSSNPPDPPAAVTVRSADP